MSHSVVDMDAWRRSLPRETGGDANTDTVLEEDLDADPGLDDPEPFVIEPPGPGSKHFIPNGVMFYVNAIALMVLGLASLALIPMALMPTWALWWYIPIAGAVLVAVVAGASVTARKMYLEEREHCVA